MPISHAAFKQLRKDKKRNARNNSVRSELRTSVRKFLSSLENNQIDEARELLKTVSKKYDMAAAKNLVHRNKVARAKSQFAKALNKATAPSE